MSEELVVQRFGSKVLDIKAWSHGSTKEMCGLVLVDGDVVLLDNAHSDPQDYIRIPAEALADHPRDTIAAVWHTHWRDSHPGELSPLDLAMAHKPDRLPQLLYHSGFDCWDYYEPNSPNPYPLRASVHPVDSLEFYRDWPFIWARMDCFALIRRYCLGVLGKDIGEWQRPDLDGFPCEGWVCPWDRQGNGLIEVDDRIQLHDLLEIAQKGGREPNHLAIVVQLGTQDSHPMILHNPGYMCRSTVEPYSLYWQHRTVRRLRFA